MGIKTLWLGNLSTLAGVAGCSFSHGLPLPGLLLLSSGCCPAPHVCCAPCRVSVSLSGWPSWCLGLSWALAPLLTKNLVYRMVDGTRGGLGSPLLRLNLPSLEQRVGKLRLEKVSLDTEATPPPQGWPISLVTLVPAQPFCPLFCPLFCVLPAPAVNPNCISKQRLGSCLVPRQCC